MRIRSNIGFASLLIVLIASITTIGQKRSDCKIGTTTFECPAGFSKLPDVDTSTRMFQSQDKDNPLMLFVAMSAGDFDDSAVRQAHSKSYFVPSGERFEWKALKNPVTMDVETKFDHRVVASLGYWKGHLVEVKSFIFSVNGKNIVIGYSYHWGVEPQANARRFEIGAGFGDSAVGCNSVVTILNSITKEFKEKKRYCSLSAFTSQ